MAEQYSVEAFLKATDQGFTKTFQEAGDTVGTLEKKTAGFTDGFKNVMKTATIAAAGAATAFAAFGINAAANTQAMEAQFTQTFGELEGEAKSSVDALGKEFGMVPERITPAFTQMTAKFKGLGMDTEAAMEQAAKATTVAADASAFYDTSMEDAQSSLNSFVNGSYEAGESIGLFANESQMAAYASETLGQDWATLDEAGKQVVRLGFAEAMQASAGATGQASRESESFSNQMGNVKSAFSTFAGAVMEPIMDPLIAGLSNAADWLVKAGDGVKAFFGWMSENQTTVKVIAIAIGTLAAAIGVYNIMQNWAAIATFASTNALAAWGAVVGFITSPITLVILAIGALVAIFYYLYNTNETVRAAIDTAWNFISSVIQSVISTVSAFVMSVWGTLVAWWAANGELVKQTAETVWNAIKSAVTAVMDYLAPFIQGAWSNITNIISAAWDFITSVVETAINLVLGIITAVMQAINGDWEGAWETIKSTLSAAWDSIVSTVTDKFVNVVDAVKTGVQDAITAFKSFVSDAIAAGSDLIGGFVQGIKDKASSLVDSVKGVVGDAIQAAKDLLKIGSPSKVFNQFGRWTDEGLANGIDAGAGGPLKSVKNMVGAVANAWNPNMFDVASNVRGINASVGQTVDHVVSDNMSGAKPAQIMLNLGGRSYTAFVDDISGRQNQVVKLEETYLGG